MRLLSLAVLGLFSGYVGSADAAVPAAASATQKADPVTPLAAQHKALAATLATQRADLAKHLRAAEAAYAPHSAPPKPSKKPPPLPKLSALQTAKTEYEAAQQASTAASKTQAALQANEDQLEHARPASSTSSKPTDAAKKAAAAHDDEKSKEQLALVQTTLAQVDTALALQSPAVPGCDLRKVPWQNMTYPWLPTGTLNNPAKFVNGAWACDELDQNTCNNTPAISDTSGEDGSLVVGDMDGDGKPEVALHVLTGCCDVGFFSVLFFTQDPQCHLRYLDSVSLWNTSGKMVNGAFVADLSYAARPGENVGLGAVSGMEHAEWRLVNGKIKKTKSVKTVGKPVQ